MMVIAFSTNQNEMLNSSVYGAPNRLMIYMSKCTPFFILTFIHKLVSYFADAKDDLPAKEL